MTVSRRTSLLVLCGAIALSACSFYREPPPVVIGGVAVAKDKPVMAALRASGEHKRFTEALVATGLDAELTGIGPLTIFAPNDAAFDGLRPKSAKALIENDLGALKQVLSGHIVRARLTTEDLLDAFPQLNGKTKVFAINSEVIRAQGDAASPRLLDLRKRTVNVVQADAIASNGILHVIDGLLLPQDEKLVSP